MQYIFTHMFARPELDRDGKKVFKFYPAETTTHNIMSAVENLADWIECYETDRDYVHTIVSCVPNDSHEQIEVKQIDLARAASICMQQREAEQRSELLHRIDTNDFYFGARG